ncbi:extracellular solute-binding protein [Clostridium thermosuccinogenes]|nr:extracellular solute-binding protein [Pseudoclostridium thermosuccinogenes]
MKMRKRFKPLAVTLACSLAVSLAITACGSDKKGSSDSTTTPSDSTSSQNSSTDSTTTGAKNDYGDTGGLTLPLVDKEVTITWMVPSAVEDLNSLAIPQEISKRTGIKLNLQPVPLQSYAEKLNVTMGSGDLPDIINGLSLADTNKYALDGAFAAINDYLDELPNFKTLYVDNPENSWILYSWSDDNGKLYKWPIYQLARDVNHGLLYRADVFKKLGIEPWTDNESFYNALKKIKEAYPDSYPFASKNGASIFSKLAKSWDISDNRYPFYYDESDGTWKFAGTDAKFKDMLDFMKKLYNEGLLDPEFLTDTQDSWSAKMTTDKAFVTWDWIGRLELFTAQVKDSNPEYDLRFGKPIGTGKQFTLPKIENWGPSVAKGKNELVALKLLDYMSSPSGSELFTIGIEGETFEWDSNGKPVYPSLKDEPLVDIALLEKTFGMWVEGMYVRPDHRSVYYNYSEREQEAQDIANKETGYLPNDPELKLTDSEMTAYADAFTAISKAVEEFAAKYVTDKGYGEAQWNEWKAKESSLKVADVLKILNDAQARYDAEVK